MTITIPNPRTLALVDVHDPAKNPNHMPEDRFRLLVAAIRERGFLQPILARPDPSSSGYIIIDGFHRCRAARILGMTEVSAVVVESEEAGAAILQIGMNRLRGELNLSEVADTLAELARTGTDVEALTVTGFSDEEIRELLNVSTGVTEPEMLGGAFNEGRDDVEDASTKVERPFTLELRFKEAKDLKLARAKLRKAVGKGGDLADGLLVLVKDA